MNDIFTVGDILRIRRRGKRGIFTADFYHNSQHRRRSLRTTHRKEAERRAWKLHEKLVTHEYRIPVKSVTLNEGLRLYIDYLRAEARSEKTIARYTGELKRVIAFARSQGIATPDQISAMLYDRYRSHRRTEDGIAAYTAWSHGIVLKQWLRFLIQRKAITTNPLADVPMRMPRRNKHPAATSEQVTAILDKTSDGPLFVLLATLAFTGMRLGEALQLTVAHVSLTDRVITLTAGASMKLKTANASRTIPIHPRLMPILTAAIGRSTTGLVFLTAAGKPWNPRRVNVLFKRIAGKLGYSVGRATLGLTTHSLRRFFKTTALDAGVPSPLVDRWVGHANSSIDYFYYDTSKQHEWMQRLPFGDPTPADLRRIKNK